MTYHIYQTESKLKRWNKSVCNLYDKNKYIAHIKPLKQALIHGLVKEVWK